MHISSVKSVLLNIECRSLKR